MDNFSGNSRSTKVKKPRKIRQSFVCSNCKRKKIKCDRQLPCHNCVNSNLTDSCHYSILPTNGPDEPSVNHNPTHTRKAQYLQRQQQLQQPHQPYQQHVSATEQSFSTGQDSPPDAILKSELDVLKQKIFGLENALKTNLSRSGSTNEALTNEPGPRNIGYEVGDFEIVHAFSES
ncbi:unnamed protein product [Ambrosiozyma monospora]|uniref:Unnamed protein product n=1 Tax=Ambrosiozyma monospora TaxID=43982 RepID=A0A9W6YWP8_AMBMO|nr:unnamed protein product [Ambrosiozyma monospora]